MGRLEQNEIPVKIEATEPSQGNSRGDGSATLEVRPLMLKSQTDTVGDHDRSAVEGEPVVPEPGNATGLNVAKQALKQLGSGVGLVLAFLPAASCWLESRLGDRGECFSFWGQALSLLPGLPGKYLRRGFYRLTLASCSSDHDIGFLSYFNDRRAEVGRRVYVGTGVILGWVKLDDGVLIGSRVSLPSGRNQHRHGPDGRLTPFERSNATRVWIGEETWIGEAAVVMADVGSHSIVAAGAVVPRTIPQGCLVGGNPARLIRKLRDDDSDAPVGEVSP